jgi:hypothetical protein
MPLISLIHDRTNALNGNTVASSYKIRSYKNALSLVTLLATILLTFFIFGFCPTLLLSLPVMCYFIGSNSTTLLSLHFVLLYQSMLRRMSRPSVLQKFLWTTYLQITTILSSRETQSTMPQCSLAAHKNLKVRGWAQKLDHQAWITPEAAPKPTGPYQTEGGNPAASFTSFKHQTGTTSPKASGRNGPLVLLLAGPIRS